MVDKDKFVSIDRKVFYELNPDLDFQVTLDFVLLGKLSDDVKIKLQQRISDYILHESLTHE